MIRLTEILQQEFVDGFDLEKFRNMKSFAERVRYCNEKLPRLGVGSSRRVYKIDDKTVLKLASNAKGIEQNNNEADGFLNDEYGDIIAKVLDYDNGNLWIVSQYAKPVTRKRFEQLLGFTIDELFMYLYNKITLHGRSDDYQDKIGEMDNNEFIQALVMMCVNMDLEVGDFRDIKSFGEIDGKLVVRDYGLTKNTYKDFYRKKDTNKYYE